MTGYYYGTCIICMRTVRVSLVCDSEGVRLSFLVNHPSLFYFLSLFLPLHLVMGKEEEGEKRWLTAFTFDLRQLFSTSPGANDTNLTACLNCFYFSSFFLFVLLLLRGYEAGRHRKRVEALKLDDTHTQNTHGEIERETYRKMRKKTKKKKIPKTKRGKLVGCIERSLLFLEREGRARIEIDK